MMQYLLFLSLELNRLRLFSSEGEDPLDFDCGLETALGVSLSDWIDLLLAFPDFRLSRVFNGEAGLPF